MNKSHTLLMGFLILNTILLGYLVYSTQELQRQGFSLSNRVDHVHEEVEGVAVGVKLLKSAALNSARSKYDASGLVPKAEVNTTEYDFGLIRMIDGVVSQQFEIMNAGEGVLSFGEIATSCGCTSASIEPEELVPGTTALLTVVFDPNIHEEPQDQFFRSVYVPTNDPENQEIEFKIYVELDN